MAARRALALEAPWSRDAGQGPLALAGEPIARDMDGRVLPEAFDDRFSRGTTIPVVDTFGPEGPP